MAAEFDTVAEWTAEVAADLGAAYHIPAGCRGSGSPAALDWLVGKLDPAPGEAFLDCGAGVGGPAAYAVQQQRCGRCLWNQRPVPAARPVTYSATRFYAQWLRRCRSPMNPLALLGRWACFARCAISCHS